MVTRIQFVKGTDEEVIPEVRITRTKDGGSATAIFFFQNPKALSEERKEEITGMYLIDDQGEIVTRDVKAKFVNGQPTEIEATYRINSSQEWDRFMYFMEQFAADHDLGFTKS